LATPGRIRNQMKRREVARRTRPLAPRMASVKIRLAN
jgi:hypothetical protein